MCASWSLELKLKHQGRKTKKERKEQCYSQYDNSAGTRKCDSESDNSAGTRNIEYKVRNIKGVYGGT
jgi:hypothetical protein